TRCSPPRWSWPTSWCARQPARASACTRADRPSAPGVIDDSWRQQPGSPVYGLRAVVAGATKALADASPKRKSDFRA
ncbi:hypothetical protein ACFVYB_39575, partial [Streptomyces sp. NPDC058228]